MENFLFSDSDNLLKPSFVKWRVDGDKMLANFFYFSITRTILQQLNRPFKVDVDRHKKLRQFLSLVRDHCK
jgi:hypothetical protein